MFVAIEHFHLSCLWIFHRNGNNLIRERSAFPRLSRELLRSQRELVDALAVPQPLVSQHLRILKSAGVVAGERTGREVMYRLVDHHLAEIVVAAVTHSAEGS